MSLYRKFMGTIGVMYLAGCGAALFYHRGFTPESIGIITGLSIFLPEGFVLVFFLDRWEKRGSISKGKVIGLLLILGLITIFVAWLGLFLFGIFPW